MPDQMTLAQFGQKIKTKYPQYANLDDTDLARKVIAKYPQYRSQVTDTAPAAAASSAPSAHPFWDRVKQKAADWWKQETTYSSSTDPAHSNVDAAFFNTLAGIPEWAKTTASDMNDVIHGRMRGEQMFSQDLDPGNIVQALQDQFRSDWKQDPGLAMQKLAGSLVAMGLTHKAGEAATGGVNAGLSKVGELRTRAAEGFRNAVREPTGVSDNTEKVVRKFGSESASARAQNREADERTLGKRAVVDQKNARAAEKHQADVEGVRRKNEDASARTLEKRAQVDKKNAGQLRKETAARQSTLQKNRETLRKHEEARAEVRQHNEGVLRQQKARSATEQKLKSASEEMDQRIETAQKSAKAENDAAWDAWRKKVAGKEIASDDIVAAMKAQKGITLHDPEDVAEFRKVLKETRPEVGEMGEDAQALHEIMEGQFPGKKWEQLTDREKAHVKNVLDSMGLDADEIDQEGARPVDGLRLHLWKQQLENAVRKATRGNVRYAIGQVLDKVRAAEDKLSADAGATSELDKARKLHGAFADTFRNPDSETQTVAVKSLRETSPEYARQKRLQEHLGMLGNYDAEIPRLAGHITNLREGLTALPEQGELKSYPPAPELDKMPEHQPGAEYEEPEPATPLPPKPEETQYEEPEAHEPLPSAPNLAVENREYLERSLRKYGRVGAWVLRLIAGGTAAALAHGEVSRFGSDLLLGQAAVTMLTRFLRKPSIIDALAKPTAEDIRIIETLPPEDASRMKEALGALVKEERVKGNTQALDPRIGAFLGANAAGQGVSRNRKEALDRLKSAGASPAQ